MSEILAGLNEIRKKIGYEAFVFLVLSFVTLTFGHELGTEAPEPLRRSIPILAGGLFATGILVGLLQIFAVFFRHRPARGLVDGLAAGLLSGLVGGYFGYGFHSGPDYVEHSFFRIALCVLFATPIGGVLGLGIDLCHPDREIPWRKYIGTLVLSVAVFLFVVGFGIFLFVPNMRGAGIILSDVQLIFELFLIFVAGIISYSFAWPARKFIARATLIATSIGIVRLITLTLSTRDPLQKGLKLYQRQFLYDAANPSNIDGQVDLAVAVVVLMCWVTFTYALFFKEHSITRWLDCQLGANFALQTDRRSDG